VRSIERKSLKALFIGIDGATDDVIGPMMAEGRLPHLCVLRERGAYGRLQSQPGYSSPALWTTIESGYPPEEHGILGFATALRANLRRPRIHERLAKVGWTIGLCRMFCNWPPSENEVFVVPSFADVHGRAKPAWVEPLCKAKELSGLWEKGRFLWHCVRAQIGLRPLFNILKAGLSAHGGEKEKSKGYFHLQNAQHWLYARVFQRLVRTYQPNYAAMMIGIADAVGHRYWGNHKTQGRGSVVEQAYVEIDKVVGELMEWTDEHTTIVIASDHGMEYVRKKGYNLVVASTLLRHLGLNSHVEAYFPGYIAYLGVAPGGPSLEDLLQKVKQTHLTFPEQPLFDPCHVVGERIRLGVARDVQYEPDRQVRLWDGRSVRLGELVRQEPRRTGDHGDGPDGILLFQGPAVRPGVTIQGATHYDVAPTVLALLGLPIPKVLKGRVLTEVMRPERACTISYTAEDEPPCHQGSIQTLNPVEEAALEKRLRELGYID